MDWFFYGHPLDEVNRTKGDLQTTDDDLQTTEDDLDIRLRKMT